MKFRSALSALALALAAGSAEASLCSLFSLNATCQFATDTSGGTAIYTNLQNLTNVGSGVIAPFLGTQVGGNGGVEVGVNTDQSAVNLLPLDDKRDNANTFTQTISLNTLATITLGGTNYYEFLLDINEPNNDPARLLSLDRLAIFGQTAAQNPGSLLDLNKNNITTLDDVDLFPNITPVYRLGVANTLVLDYSLFAGSGNGYDMALFIPVSQFAGLAPNSRLVFAVQYGALAQAGADAADGFEEWAAVIGPQISVPEPGTLALLGVALFGIGFTRRKQH